MAAEASEITYGNRLDFLGIDDHRAVSINDHDVVSGYLPGPDGKPVAVPFTDADMLIHILQDLHLALKMLSDQGRLLAKHDELLEEFRPLLDRYRSPLASRLPRGRNARG
jgi:hypothetical protein